MADEIRIRCSIACENGNFRFPEVGGRTLARNQTNPAGGGPGIVVATTSGVDITLGNNVTGSNGNGAWMRLENIEANASLNVEFGPKVGGTFYPFGKLQIGDVALFKLTGNNTGSWHLKATSANTKILVTVFDA